MGSYRTNNSSNEYKIDKEKGATLIFSIALAIAVLIVLGGLYYMITRGFKVSQDVKTYSSVKEAANAAVNYAVLLINQDMPSKNGADMPGRCINNPYLMKYKLFGSNDNYETKIQICLIGYETLPGYEVQGVAYTKSIGGGKGEMYSIVVESEGPNNTKIRIESVFRR